MPSMSAGQALTCPKNPIGVNIELRGTKKNAPSVKGFFHSRRPPTQTLEAALTGECKVERTVDQMDTEKDEENKSNKEDLLDKQNSDSL